MITNLPQEITACTGKINDKIRQAAGASTVFILKAEEGDFILKYIDSNGLDVEASQSELRMEHKALQILRDSSPKVPKVFLFGEIPEVYCLYSLLEGQSLDKELHDKSVEERALLIKKYAETLRDIHMWKPESFPLSSAQDSVFSHGDYSPQNVIIQNSNVTGVIDWGAAGYGPRVDDLRRALQWLAPEDRHTFLENYETDDSSVCITQLKKQFGLVKV